MKIKSYKPKIANARNCDLTIQKYIGIKLNTVIFRFTYVRHYGLYTSQL